MKGNPLKDQNPQEWKSQTWVLFYPMKKIQMPFFSSKKVGFWQMYLLLRQLKAMPLLRKVPSTGHGGT